MNLQEVSYSKMHALNHTFGIYENLHISYTTHTHIHTKYTSIIVIRHMKFRFFDKSGIKPAMK